ncbi:MAG: hypothetical protein IT370_00220 [Deltaproteobacteria bacterium]|nr:hypothetical protein [Deltaproteobacteria bacterium]
MGSKRVWVALSALGLVAGLSCSGPADAPDSGVPDAALDAATIIVDAAVDAARDAAAMVDAGPQVVPCSDLRETFGSPVMLQQATATLAQTFDNGPYLPANAIDGSDSTGWAISPTVGSTTTPAQTAAFETVTDTASFGTGTRLVIVLAQRFANEHGLGRFRLSVTTADRSQFADGVSGVSTPGNIGPDNIWTVLTPRRMCSTNSAMMTLLGDRSVLVQDLDTNVMDYTIEADTSLSAITGVRLETLNDASLPRGGPGLQNTNGNFVLSELRVRVGAQ